MTNSKLLLLFIAVLGGSLAAHAQTADPAPISQVLRSTAPKSPRPRSFPPVLPFRRRIPALRGLARLPAHCRVDGVINRRKGVDGQEFGIGFALALPESVAWNGDFMMQGGGGGNGVIAYPAGASYAGDKPALSRGFAVASTDTGHKAKTGAFDFSFMRDQQAYLDFAFLANAEVAGVAKQIIAHYYAKPTAYSYFVGCSTGGRGEIVANRRNPACALGGDDAPVAFNEVDVAISGMTLDVEEANLGMVCRLNFLVGILCEFKGQPHVRLATA